MEKKLAYEVTYFVCWNLMFDTPYVRIVTDVVDDRLHFITFKGQRLSIGFHVKKRYNSDPYI